VNGLLDQTAAQVARQQQLLPNANPLSPGRLAPARREAGRGTGSAAYLHQISDRTPIEVERKS
jgi:hypothetical protein